MQKQVILGVTGSIAAYKSIDIAKQLLNHNYAVEVVLTQSAENFVSVKALKAFGLSVFTHQDDFSPHSTMTHIDLAKKADVVLIAPLSANTLAKITYGLSDDLLTNIVLATKAPLFIAPAMNMHMWSQPIVQHNFATLLQRGVQSIGPISGVQACGDDGFGKMADIDSIVHRILHASTPLLLKGRKVLITAGSTLEKIDPVRYITNFSSGKMGFALASVASYMGAEVHLVVGGKVDLPIPLGVKPYFVESADSMLHQTLTLAAQSDLFIGVAAVADFKPNYHPQKIKKSPNQYELSLTLSKNPDIIATVKQTYPHLFCVGFAAETESLISNAQYKLTHKGLDAIVANNVSNGQVFNQANAEVTFITPTQTVHIPNAPKSTVAETLLTHIAALMPKV